MPLFGLCADVQNQCRNLPESIRFSIPLKQIAYHYGNRDHENL